jgi:hypothetical protein
MMRGQPAVEPPYHYSAYNLAIWSAIALPDLPPSSGGSDFEIRLECGGDLIEERRIEWRELPAREARFHYPALARFTVLDGRELIITTDPRGDTTILRLYVQGMMLASALYQRGLFVLHASVVEVDGRAIGFLGPVGAGKSTFASAFRALHHKVLADDNAAIDLDGAHPRVLPAFPSLKVYPEVARSLGFQRDSLHPMHASQIKEAQPLGDGFSANPLPLHCLYVLDREAEGPLARIPPVETIRELIRHSVPTRWGVAGDGRHLRMCSSLAQRVPLFRVRTFRDLHEIPMIAREIERHATNQVEHV